MRPSLWTIFWQNEAGQDLIEYALLLAFISICSLSLLLAFQGNINGLWDNISSGLSTTIQAAS
jgi:Flp pilus assembly pilin Flp